MNGPPGSPTRRVLLDAWQRHRAGDVGAAEAAYRRYLGDAPGNPDANNLLGLLCLQTGRPREARQLIERALRADPDNAQSEHNLGLASAQLRDFDAAERHFRRATGLAPRDVEARNSLGNVLRLLGRVDEAGGTLESALRMAPANPRLHCNLGHVRLAQRRPAEAEACFRRSLEFEPGLVEAMNGLAESLLDQGMPGEARVWLEKAVGTGDASADAWNNLGVACNVCGNADTAERAFRRATEIEPRHARAWLNLGCLQEESGALRDAATSYQHAADADADLAEAHFRLAHLRTHRATTGEISAMQSLAARLPEDERKAQLLCGLGFAFESAGQYDEAFRCMTEFHAIQRRLHPFSLDAERGRVERIMRLYDAAALAPERGSGLFDRRPLLVVGLPRSGTTLVEQILASHPRVHANGETNALAVAARAVSSSPTLPYPVGCEAPGRERLRAAADEYVLRLTTAAGDALRVTDTTPMNFLLLGLAAQLLPGATFVYCRREPHDLCLSIYRQWFTGPHAYAHDLADLGGFYGLHRRLMRHWQGVMRGRILDLSYEALVREPQAEIRRLLDFCGLPFDERCLEFHRTERRVRTPSASQVRSPMHARSVGSWRYYERHLATLVTALRESRGMDGSGEGN